MVELKLRFTEHILALITYPFIWISIVLFDLIVCKKINIITSLCDTYDIIYTDEWDRYKA